MAKRINWDFALRLRGVRPDSIPMSKLAEYMADWADLLGQDAAPVFRGVVDGSVVLRAEVAPTAKNQVKNRLREAPYDDGAGRFIKSLQRRMSRDGIMGTVIDKTKEVILRFDDVVEVEALAPIIVEDAAEIDGTVFRIQGKDATSHVGLLEYGSDRTFSVETRSDLLARQFAENYKGPTLRVRVHGTWRRDESGQWEPYHLIADSFEVLDDQPLADVMHALREVPNNGWKSMDDPIGEWRKIRGLDA